jgi:hypothetical protein
MRFRRWPRMSVYEDTPRKRVALARAQQVQRDKFPLLAPIIAERQPSADAEMARRAASWPKVQQCDRDRRADDWRRARARLAAHGDNLRPLLIQLWRDSPYPADPVYLLDMLHSIDTGRIDPERPPWIPGHSDSSGKLDSAAAPEGEAGRGLCDGFGGRERGSRPARHGEPTWQPPNPRSS